MCYALGALLAGGSALVECTSGTTAQGGVWSGPVPYAGFFAGAVLVAAGIWLFNRSQ